MSTSNDQDTSVVVLEEVESCLKFERSGGVGHEWNGHTLSVVLLSTESSEVVTSEFDLLTFTDLQTTLSKHGCLTIELVLQNLTALDWMRRHTVDGHLSLNVIEGVLSHVEACKLDKWIIHLIHSIRQDAYLVDVVELIGKHCKITTNSSVTHDSRDRVHSLVRTNESTILDRQVIDKLIEEIHWGHEDDTIRHLSTEGDGHTIEGKTSNTSSDLDTTSKQSGTDTCS